MQINTRIILKSFLGKEIAEDNIDERENYWKLIGEKGKVIDNIVRNNGRVLVLFDKNLDDFNVENHNPIRNSLWIKKSDLKIDSNFSA